MKKPFPALSLAAIFACASCSGDEQSTNDLPEEHAVDSDGIGCPVGTRPAGETVPEVREAWCELDTNEGVVQHGPYRAWYPNGVRGTQGQFERNQAVGTWYGWYESGAKQGEIVYDGGEQVSATWWDEQGNLLESPPE